LWSHDEHELLFEAPDLRVMAVSCTAKGDTFTTGRPHVWSATRLVCDAVSSAYDLAPDGKRLPTMLARDEHRRRPRT